MELFRGVSGVFSHGLPGESRSSELPKSSTLQSSTGTPCNGAPSSKASVIRGSLRCSPAVPLGCFFHLLTGLWKLHNRAFGLGANKARGSESDPQTPGTGTNAPPSPGSKTTAPTRRMRAVLTMSCPLSCFKVPGKQGYLQQLLRVTGVLLQSASCFSCPCSCLQTMTYMQWCKDFELHANSAACLPSVTRSLLWMLAGTTSQKRKQLPRARLRG